MPRRKTGPHVKYRTDRNTWEIIEFVEGRRKRLSGGFSSRECCEERLAEIIFERNTPQTNEREITLGELIAYYIKEHVPTISNPKTVLNCLERIVPFWGNLKLEDIKKSKSLKYTEYRKSEFKQWQINNGYASERILSKETVRREIEQLQACINFAYHDNIISICPYVWKPEKSKPRTRWLTRSEAASLLRESRNNPKTRDYLPLFILIGIYTGARSQSILKLRWIDVDLQNNIIDMTRSYDTSIKQGSKIPIPRKLKLFLKLAQKRGTELGYVVHNHQNPIKSVKRSFSTAVIRAELEDVTPHTLRHTCASWLMQNGVPNAKIAKYLGHTSTQMIEKTYGHLSPDHLSDVTDAFG